MIYLLNSKTPVITPRVKTQNRNIRWELIFKYALSLSLVVISLFLAFTNRSSVISKSTQNILPPTLEDFIEEEKIYSNEKIIKNYKNKYIVAAYGFPDELQNRSGFSLEDIAISKDDNIIFAKFFFLSNLNVLQFNSISKVYSINSGRKISSYSENSNDYYASYDSKRHSFLVEGYLYDFIKIERNSVLLNKYDLVNNKISRKIYKNITNFSVIDEYFIYYSEIGFTNVKLINLKNDNHITLKSPRKNIFPLGAIFDGKILSFIYSDYSKNKQYNAKYNIISNEMIEERSHFKYLYDYDRNFYQLSQNKLAFCENFNNKRLLKIYLISKGSYLFQDSFEIEGTPNKVALVGGKIIYSNYQGIFSFDEKTKEITKIMSAKEISPKSLLPPLFKTSSSYIYVISKNNILKLKVE